MSRTEQAADAASSVRGRLQAAAYATCTPLNVTVEITKRCNLRCVHCYVRGDVSRELPLHRLADLFGELAREGCLAVNLTGGELALRDDWLDIAREVKRSRLLLTVLTNGTLLDERQLATLAGLRPFRVCVSVYAGSPEVHDAITGVSGSFEASLATLRYLRTRGVRCRVGSVVMAGNVQEVGAIRRLAGELDCEFLFDPTVAPCEDGSADVTASRIAMSDLWSFYTDEVIAERSREGRIVHTGPKPSSREPRNCSAGFTGAFVEADGEVYACMGLEPSFGNVRDASFGDLWRGQVAAHHREAMQRPLHECESCDLLPYCTARCPRLAQAEEGSVSAPSRRACEIAEITRRLRVEVMQA